MLIVVGILLFFFGLLFSIAFHELGHLATAKLFGIKVTQYMVGFGRTVFSRKSGDTEYGLKLIPFGGYIRMIGMFPPKKEGDYGTTRSSSPFRAMIEDAREAVAEEVRPEDAHRQFYQRKPWKRIIVMAAGPFMNLLLAILLFSGVLMGYGQAQLTTTVGEISECVLPADAVDQNKCPPDAPPTPAVAAGLHTGDHILNFNGTPIQSWEQLQRVIRDSRGAVPMEIERDGQRRTLQVPLIQNPRPKLDGSGGLVEVGFLGVQPTKVLVPQGIGGVARTFGGMLSLTAQKIVELPQRVPDLISAIGGNERAKDSPIGIVGASRIGGEVLSYDQESVAARLVLMVQLLAGVNLSLFVINLLPLLPLDGGHIVGALWESIRRAFARVFRRPDPGPFDTAKLMPLAYAVSMVFIAYSLLVLIADVVNPVTLF